MIAVFINCTTVILGSLVGLLFAKRISAGMTDVVKTACGLVSLVLGIQMALNYGNIVYLALALILGGLMGTWIDIDQKILDFGGILERLVSGHKSSGSSGISGDASFARAFLNSSVLFCVGAMSILGSIQAGIDKNYSIILTKSMMDGFMSMALAAAMGIGTLFSALTILVYQGALTLLAGRIAAYASPQMLTAISASGGVMVLMIGVNLTGLRAIKTANYLPTLVFSALFVALDPLVRSALPI
ncbi:MAG: DUF554 domain-containing protein [Spirochaetaceae bacterium]|jgi:uncharacterized membrane protein YqgA involved in biofilm formation|nr:DUF554 domain-containing protein [Spirochaetaceae bacterium]